MDRLLNFFDSIVPLKSNLIEELRGSSYLLKLQSRTILLQEGDVSEYVYVNLEGSVRSFKFDGQEDWTNWFFAPGDIVFNTSGFFSKQPSRDSLQTISDCCLVRIKRQNFDELCRQHADFKSIFDILFDKFLEKRWEYGRGMSRLNAAERYEWFQLNFPDVNRVVQLKDLASYLGIAPQHLSRIRNSR